MLLFFNHHHASSQSHPIAPPSSWSSCDNNNQNMTRRETARRHRRRCHVQTVVVFFLALVLVVLLSATTTMAIKVPWFVVEPHLRAADVASFDVPQQQEQQEQLLFDRWNSTSARAHSREPCLWPAAAVEAAARWADDNLAPLVRPSQHFHAHEPVLFDMAAAVSLSRVVSPPRGTRLPSLMLPLTVQGIDGVFRPTTPASRRSRASVAVHDDAPLPCVADPLAQRQALESFYQAFRGT